MPAQLPLTKPTRKHEGEKNVTRQVVEEINAISPANYGAERKAWETKVAERAAAVTKKDKEREQKKQTEAEAATKAKYEKAVAEARAKAVIAKMQERAVAAAKKADQEENDAAYAADKVLAAKDQLPYEISREVGISQEKLEAVLKQLQEVLVYLDKEDDELVKNMLENVTWEKLEEAKPGLWRQTLKTIANRPTQREQMIHSIKQAHRVMLNHKARAERNTKRAAG